MVRIGDRDLESDEDDDKVAISPVKTISFHPKFNNIQAYYDIAVLALETRIRFNDYVRPICLPKRSQDFDVHKGAFVTLTGN